MKRLQESRPNLAMTLADLQSAFLCLKEAVLYGKETPSEFKTSLVQQIEEAMQWDHVYDLSSMEGMLRDFSKRLKEVPVDSEIKVWTSHVQSTLREALNYSHR